MSSCRSRKNLMAGMATGVAGGLVASWVMNLFLSGLSTARQAAFPPDTRTKRPEEEEDATEKVADALMHQITGARLNKQQKKQAGPFVHYAFGALMGGVYGAIAEYSEASRMGFGTLFGTALFIGADEIVVPALGLGKPPNQEPIANQASHLAAHLVYGSAVEAVRRGVRRLF